MDRDRRWQSLSKTYAPACPWCKGLYAWAERNSKPEIPSDEKQKRNKVNGMMSVDAVTGEIYLQLKSKSKTEDVAMYFADLCKDAQAENIEKVSIVLDNNSTHKDKIT